MISSNKDLTFNPRLNIVMNMTQTQIKQIGTILLLTPVAAYVTYKIALEVWCIVYGLIY
jgi:hypothetical protein